MGRVITTNSATLVNKGLEVIEAHLLFDIPFDRIDVVVHPQQLIHSMVEFVDGAVVAQLGLPTMLVPIALGMGWPDRVPDAETPIDWTRAADWRFEPLDDVVFPAVTLARTAGERGGTAPAVYNAANEVARRRLPRRPAELPRHRLHGCTRPGPPRRTIEGALHRRRRPRRRLLGASRGRGPDLTPP